MKKIILACISLYQLVISPSLMHLFGTKYICRYSLTCSEYAKQAILKKGVIMGGYLALKRILSCQPYLDLYGSH